MTSTIVIKYSGNPKKAGKLSVIDYSGKKVLSKIPVSIPSSMLSSLSEMNIVVKVLSLSLNSRLMNNVFADKPLVKDYQESFNKLTNSGRNADFLTDFETSNDIFMKSDNVLSTDNLAFTVKSDDFRSIIEAVSRSSKINVEINKTSFLFFSDDLEEKDKKDIHSSYYYFKSCEGALVSQVRNKELDFERVKAEEKARKKKEEEDLNKKKKQRKSNNHAPIQDDHLNDFLAFYNPALALMFKPHSALAWFLYFNDMGNAVSQDMIDQNIHQISGFENICASELYNKDNGYQVIFFSDEDKNEQVGVLNVDSLSGECTLTTQTGEKNIVTPEDNGKVNLSFVSENGNSTTVEMVQDGDKFVGNWNSNQIGAPIGGALMMDNNFGFTSETDKTNDLTAFSLADTVKDNVVYDDSTSRDDFSLTDTALSDSSSLNVPTMNDYDSTPVSSPASDNSSWVSADPYSN